MDDNPQDQFQMSCPMIKLKSSDGEIFEVEVQVAKLSLYIKTMLDDLGVEENEVISIPENAPQISGAILKKIVQWASHHKNDPVAAKDDNKQVKSTDDISSWDDEFLQVDPTTLVQVIRAANYLDIEGLLDVTCKKVAKIIKGMTVDDVRETFGMQNDFSPEEEKQVRRDYMWCKESDFQGSVSASVMDKIPTDSVQNMKIIDNGDGHGQVLEHCLSNTIGLRIIFQHISDPELLKLSFVSKLWNYEARSVIKERGNLCAHFKCNGIDVWGRQGEFQDFLAATKQMNIVPFSGIKIIFQNPWRSVAFPNEVLESIHDEDLKQLQLKKVSLRFYGVSDRCSGFLLAKKVLQDFSEVLEALSLRSYTNKKNYIEDIVEECRFPVLKVLKLEKDYYTPVRTYQNDIKELVVRAPRLQELHTTGPIDSVFNALTAVERSSVVIVHMPKVYAPFNEVPQAVIGKLKLKNVELFCTDPRFNLDKFSQIAPVLLKDSCTTIRTMRIDTVFAVPLMSYGVNFEMVESLHMRINYRQLELLCPRILEIVKQFDFTRTFSNLKEVWICESSSVRPLPDHVNRIVEHANAVLPDPTPDRAAHVKKMHISSFHLSNATVQFLAEMFPCIVELQVHGKPGREFSFGSIWEHWKNLIDFRIAGDIIPNAGNLDSVFCGIFPEEIAELRQKDDEYLNTVHIVPVMPAVTCLKNLKRLYLSHGRQCHWRDVKDGTLMFSKVTRLIAFARCPSLVEIKLHFGLVFAASHMEPFAYTVKC